MSNFCHRPVACYDLPLSVDAIILKPEQVIMRFPDRNTIDIGALCYLQREATPKDKRNFKKNIKGRAVLLSSLCPIRCNHVRAFITHISNEVRHGRKKDSTINKAVGKFIQFMAWADGNGYSSALVNADSTRRAVCAYAKHIQERFICNVISLNTAARVQSETFTLLSEFLEIDKLTEGINLLCRDVNSVETTVPPSEDDQARVLALLDALFNGLATLVLEKKLYPFGVIMPSFMCYPRDTMWVFPANFWCFPTDKISNNEETFIWGGFNYYTGRLVTQDELMALPKYKGGRYSETIVKKKVAQTLAGAKQLIDRANSEPFFSHRRFMGMVAHNAFMMLFLSRTGINWADAVKLTWSGNYTDSISTIRQKFRSIKFRAGNKKVSYQLPLKFMPLFKRFLQLRNFLLQGYENFNGLFFSMGPNKVNAPALVRAPARNLYKSFQRIDPSLPSILGRKWRAAKSDWVIPRTDISTTAQVLQNSERTVAKSYAAGSVETHLREMSTFLDQMVLKKGAVLAGSSASAVGECVSYGNPHEIPGVDAVVLPNCQSPEVGCLFCDKYKIHADAVDIRKLLSCRYCLTRTSHLAGFHVKSEPLIERIQSILDEVHKRDASLVPRIAEEVNEGELDPYWANKFDMLLRLGLVKDAD